MNDSVQPVSNLAEADTGTALQSSKILRLEDRIQKLEKKSKPLPPRYKRRLTYPEAIRQSIVFLCLTAIIIALILAYVP